VARPIRDVPEVGTSLKGPRPQEGFGMLLCARTDKAFKVIFEQVDCDAPAIAEASGSRPVSSAITSTARRCG
jgi:hypothetical protein